MATQALTSFPPAPCCLQLLRLQHTLFLLLLACYQQQEAVSPLDLARWALDGRLPYLSFGAQEGAALRQFRGVLGPKLLSPTGAHSQGGFGRAPAGSGGRTAAGSSGQPRRRFGTPPSCLHTCLPLPLRPLLPSYSAGVGSPFYLQAQAAELAAALGLRCPPLNAPLLLQRYLTELELPQVGTVWAVPPQSACNCVPTVFCL